MLHRAEAFEPITGEPWDEARIRAAIRTIVERAGDGYRPGTLWPVVEPTDALGREADRPVASLYSGAAGAIWGLDHLERRGFAASRLDLAEAARVALDAWRARPDLPETAEPPVSTHASLFDGETGPLLVAWKLSPDAALADALFARVVQNRDTEANELMVGAPGTMLVARAMHAWTGEARWAQAWQESAEVLWSRRQPDGFWIYPPYGKGVGAAHGIGTNTGILLAGGDLLAPERAAVLPGDTARALAGTAVVEDGLANWPMSAEDHPDLVGFDGQIRVQWCHGAAGVVASAARWLDEELLLSGAELVWRVGPPGMAKGPGICHGTAGNGYAFLATFERTGDERWLDRARRFAVHALGQVERWRAERGAGRTTLWTGDVGAAIYAADCLEARTGMPVLGEL